jgi:hypothetical protein
MLKFWEWTGVRDTEAVWRLRHTAVMHPVQYQGQRIQQPDCCEEPFGLTTDSLFSVLGIRLPDQGAVTL